MGPFLARTKRHTMCHSAAGSICCTMWCFYGFATCMLFGSFGFWNTDYFLVEEYGEGTGWGINASTATGFVYYMDQSACKFPYDDEEKCVKLKIGASFIAAGLLY